MKQMLEHLINVIQKKDLELMFGEGSKVVINNVIYSTNQKKVLIDSTIYATFTNTSQKIISENIEESLAFYPYGLNILIEEGWKYMGIQEKLIFINKIDVT